MIKRIRKRVVGISRGATRQPELEAGAPEQNGAPGSGEPGASDPSSGAAALTPVPAGDTPAATPASPATASGEGQAPASAESGEFQFRLSRFTIKVKLLTIISAIIIVSMSLMIFLATRSFLNDSIKRVQENNLNLAEVIGLKAEADFRTAVSNAELLVASQDEGFATRFFEKNPGIFFVGVATGTAGGLSFDRTYYNQAFLERNSMTAANVDELHSLHGASFAGVFSGATIVENISPGFAVPALAAGRPLEPAAAVSGDEGDGAADAPKALVIYLDAEAFLKAFAGSENSLTRTFMVNSAGYVIAHPDGDLMLSRTDLSESRIVNTLLESKVQLGQAEYTEEGTEYLGSYRRLDFAGLGVVSTVEREEALAAVYKIRNQNLLLLIILLNVALLVVYFYARSMSIPIVRLAAATREIEQGQYDIELRSRSRDEVGLLTASFANMARGLGERERMKDAFGRFVNKEIAEQAMRGELKLGGERKAGAVFFSDLRGFTALSEGMEPEEVVVYLNHYFTAMVSCVNRTGGTVDKFIGDAIMAHWGTLTEVENPSERAIDAGLHMRQALIEFNQKGFGPEAKMGSGINTGPVIAGQIGSEERLEYTVIGDAVNLASRIEALNKPFRTDLLISQDTYEDVKDIFRVEHMPAIKVKGKSEPQTVYAVLGRFDDPNAPTTIGQLREILGIPDDPDAKQPAVVEDGGEVKYEVLDQKPKQPDAPAPVAREVSEPSAPAQQAPEPEPEPVASIEPEASEAPEKSAEPDLVPEPVADAEPEPVAQVEPPELSEFPEPAASEAPGQSEEPGGSTAPIPAGDDSASAELESDSAITETESQTQTAASQEAATAPGSGDLPTRAGW